MAQINSTHTAQAFRANAAPLNQPAKVTTLEIEIGTQFLGNDFAGRLREQCAAGAAQRRQAFQIP